MFSKIYDLLMEDVDYSIIYQWIKPHIKKEHVILDAGCGSGYLLVELLKHHHYAFGLDMDSKMLSLARDKLILENLPVELYEHDLRKPLGIKVDIVLMMFDVVNYFKGIKGVFSHVYHALNYQGKFIFDIYKETVLVEYKNYIESEDQPIPYTWEIAAYHTQLRHKVTINQEVDYINQYIHPLRYYLDVLSSCGFSFQVFDGPDERKYYIIAYKK